MTDSEEVSSVSDVGENETTESEEIEQNTEESNWVGDEGTAEDHMTEPTTETSEWEDDMRTAESEVTEPTSEEITESEEIKPLSTETEEEGESIMAEGELKNTSEVGDMEDTGISELGPGEGLEEGKDFKPDSSEGGVESEENTKEGEEFESGTVERLPTIQELVEEIITRGTKDYGEYQLGEEDEPRTPERLPTIQELLDEIITRGTKDYGEYQLGEEDEPRPPERLPTIQELLEEIITRGTKDYGKSQLGEEDEPRPPERLPTVQELLEEILKRGIGETTKSESRIAGRRPTIQELLEEIIRRGTGEQVERDEDELREDEFKLSFVYLMTFTDRFRDGTRELIVRGNDLYLRKGRRLRDVDMRIVCEFLHENPHVVSVDLAYNEITDKGIGIIADFLSTHDSVRRLNVMGNNIGPEGIKKLADLGEKFPLESLRVNGNKIGVEGGKSLAAILDYNVRLRQLDMGQTDQTLSSLVYITTALYANTTLQILDLSRPLGLFMHALDSAHWAETLGLALQFNKTLQELHLQKSDLIDHDIELMLIGMKYNNNLLLLDLGCNRLGNHSMEILGSYLKQRPALIALILDHNHIGDLGARCLSFTMPFSKIQLLDLSHNKVTDVGLGEILMTVKKTVRLRAFYIWGNPITPKSCPMLGRLIRGGVLQKDWVDFEIYTVDGVDYLAYQNVDRSRHIYYCVGDFAFPQPRPLPKPRSAMPPTAMLLPRIPFSAKYIPFSPTHPRLKGGPPYLRRHPEENPTQVRASTMTSALTSMSRRSVGRFGSTTETSYTERDISIQTDPE